MKQQIRVNLVRYNNPHDIQHGYEFEIVKIIGAIVVFAHNAELNAGQRIDKAAAEDLARAYEVTVTPHKTI